MAGKKAAHPNPLNAYKRAATHAALKELFDTRKISQTQILKELAEVSSRKPQSISATDFNNADFIMDGGTLSRWIANINQINPAFAWAIFIWLTANQNDILRRKLREADLHFNERFVDHYSKATGVELDFKHLRELHGAYEVYRPSFANPADIMVSIMKIGPEDNQFDCELISKVLNELGESVDEHFAGKAMPSSKRMTCVVSARESTLTMHFDRIKHSNDQSGKVDFLEGVMLAAADHYPSSAWPVFAIPAKEAGLVPRLVAASERGSVPRAALESMRRGCVHWQPQHYLPPLV